MKPQARIHVDNRSDPRIYDPVRFKLFVVLGREFRSPHEVAQEVACDISEGGLRFHDEWGVPADKLLEFHMHIPTREQTIKQYARVRWMAPAADRPGFDIGVQFVGAGEDDYQAWTEYVRTRRDVRPRS